MSVKTPKDQNLSGSGSRSDSHEGLIIRDTGVTLRHVPALCLWLGHVGDIRDLDLLFSSNIKAVVDLAADEPPPVITRELVYCRFPLLDGPGNPSWLLRSAIGTVAGFIRTATPTLIYCSAGTSRSPCIAGAAIALVRGCKPAQGLATALHAGPAAVSPALWLDVQNLLF